MNFCMPYIYMVNDLFRCLFHDLKMEFTAAPLPGKYTRQIGCSYGGGMLCSGLEEALGSLVECRYLGADTALVLAPCGGCSAERIKSKLANCLSQNGVALSLVSFASDASSQKAFWKQLRRESAVGRLHFLESRKKFEECAALLQVFLHTAQAVKSNENYRRYVQSAAAQIQKSDSLLQLKIVLSLYTKRLRVLAQTHLPKESEPASFPYHIATPLASKANEQAEAFLPLVAGSRAVPVQTLAPAKCPEGGDLCIYI